jgi:hypothetical protein
MASKKKPIPDDMTIDQAADFWDNHSVADYPSHVIQLEYTPGEHTTFIAIENDLLVLLEKQAKEHGVSVEALVNSWIQERLTA